MIAMAPDSALLLVWIAFSGVALAGILAVLVWAVRSGQFGDQDRARYLPLESEIPDGLAAGVPRGEGVLPLRIAGVPPASEAMQADQGGPDDVQP
jgi:nitrogen fixation-related uncharacterized protein